METTGTQADAATLTATVAHSATKHATKRGTHESDRWVSPALAQRAATQPTEQIDPRIPKWERAGDIAAESDEPVQCLVDGLLGIGETALLVSKPKIGKTTFATGLAVAVARGDDFLGGKTHKGHVLYVALEGNRRAWKQRLKAISVRPEDPFDIYIGRTQSQAIPWLKDSVEKYNPVLIVVDTFQRFTGVKDINNYSEVTAATEPLIELARVSGATILFLHHAGKKRSDDPDSGPDEVLGSTALHGFVDSLLMLRLAGGKHVLSTSQRDIDRIEGTIVTLNSDTHCLENGGEFSIVAQTETDNKVIRFLTENAGWHTREAVIDGSGVRKETVLASLRRMVHESGHIIIRGSGKKGDSYQFAVPGTQPPEKPEPKKKPASSPPTENASAGFAILSEIRERGADAAVLVDGSLVFKNRSKVPDELAFQACNHAAEVAACLQHTFATPPKGFRA